MNAVWVLGVTSVDPTPIGPFPRPRTAPAAPGEPVRNAIEHGGADSLNGERDAEGRVVRVGDFDAGFYVEDTGPAIPESKREKVFEQGLSTGGDGAGLALAIVRSAVRAHGWSISIGENPEGGARFEISIDRDAAVEVT